MKKYTDENDIKGYCQTYCDSLFYLNINDMEKIFVFTVMSNQIYIQAKLEKKSDREYTMFLVKPDELARGGMGLSWKDFSKG